MVLLRPGLCTIICLAVSLSGCGDARTWEVTVENKADTPCSIVIRMRADGSSTAKVDDLAPGKSVSLIGGTGETVVHSLKLKRGQEEQERAPNEKLLGGKRFAIVVGTDGKLTHTQVER